MPHRRPVAKRPAMIIINMAQDDPVDKVPHRAEEQLEAHRHELIKEVLRQKEAAIKTFDEKLAKLGYDGEHAPKRSHHKDDADKKASE